MRSQFWAIGAPLLATLFSSLSSVQAQETMAGVGAASGIGATLGAAANGGGMRARPSMNSNGAMGAEGMMGEGAGNPQFPGATTTTTTQTTVTRVTTPLAGRAGGGEAILGQLLAPRSRPRTVPTRTRRSARAQAAYARRVARLSPTARKKLVLNKYRIAPRGYLASYLLADRYKFAKAWKYVSTETDRFYYSPRGMAARGFNANRVIGFRTWQDAMLAGYRPDPVSKPEPGNQLAYLATLTRDEPLTQYVDYIYAGQVSPISVTNTVNYVRRVKSVIDRNPRARKYQRETINSILLASLTGNPNLIPRQLGYVAPVVPVGVGDPGAGSPEFPTATVQGAPQGAGALASNRGSGGPPRGFAGPPPSFGPPSGSPAGALRP